MLLIFTKRMDSSIGKLKVFHIISLVLCFVVFVMGATTTPGPEPSGNWLAGWGGIEFGITRIGPVHPLLHPPALYFILVMRAVEQSWQWRRKDLLHQESNKLLKFKLNNDVM